MWVMPKLAHEVGWQPRDLPLHLGKVLARSYLAAREQSYRVFGHGKGDRAALSHHHCSREKDAARGAPLLGTPTPFLAG